MQVGLHASPNGLLLLMESVNASASSEDAPSTRARSRRGWSITLPNAESVHIEYRPLTIAPALLKSHHSPWATAGSLLALGAALVFAFGQ
jgi:hypothetical protein